jgi:hypothetical protein
MVQTKPAKKQYRTGNLRADWVSPITTVWLIPAANRYEVWDYNSPEDATLM